MIQGDIYNAVREGARSILTWLIHRGLVIAGWAARMEQLSVGWLDSQRQLVTGGGQLTAGTWRAGLPLVGQDLAPVVVPFSRW
jgi:hypothetical protein